MVRREKVHSLSEVKLLTRQLLLLFQPVAIPYDVEVTKCCENGM
jgi:hypothetical protein